MPDRRRVLPGFDDAVERDPIARSRDEPSGRTCKHSPVVPVGWKDTDSSRRTTTRTWQSPVSVLAHPVDPRAVRRIPGARCGVRLQARQTTRPDHGHREDGVENDTGGDTPEEQSWDGRHCSTADGDPIDPVFVGAVE
jgi:hypothetical protein